MTRRSRRGSGSIADQRAVTLGSGKSQEPSTVGQGETRSARVLRSRLLAFAVVFVVAAAAAFGGHFIASQPIGAQPQPTLTSAAMAAIYVGREVCGQCHASEVTAWETSHHAHAMQPATESTVHGDFNDAHFVYGDVTTTFTRKDGKFMVRTDGPDGALQDYEVKFTFGVTPLEQYLLEHAARAANDHPRDQRARQGRARRQGARRRRRLPARPGFKCGAVDPPAKMARHPLARLPGLPQRKAPAAAAPPRPKLMQPQREKPQTAKTSEPPSAVFRMKVMRTK